ncbi:Oscp1 protein [Pycnococcus provasolii]
MGHLAAMPFLVVALGCEMVYILEQRLRAQSVAGEKAVRVLGDIARTLFAERFMEEVLKPQACYSVASLRQIFERVAHSSIMRLSESSMDKLFDLMVMGAKYQLVALTSPQEVLRITDVHLSSVAKLLQEPPLVQIVENVKTKLLKRYAQYEYEDWNDVRSTLLNALQDKRVKVSLFLHEKIQTSEGRIAVPPPERANASGKAVGTIRVGSAQEKVVDMACYEPDDGLYFYHMVELGGNLYAKDRRVPPRPDADNPAASSSSPEAAPSSPTTLDEPIAEDDAPTSARRGRGEETRLARLNDKGRGRNELNLLSALMGVQASSGNSRPADNFKLNLFGDDRGSSAPTSTSTAKNVTIPQRGPSVMTLNVDSRANREHKASVTEALKGLDLDTARQPFGGGGGLDDDDEDDLLALMDQAG